MRQRRFFYQPSPIISTIDWCWTLVILLTGIIFWLEVTHFQWITLTFLLSFLVIAGAELLDRQLIINGTALIVKNVFGRQWHRFNLRGRATQVSLTQHQLRIVNHGRHYRFILLDHEIRQIRSLLERAER